MTLQFDVGHGADALAINQFEDALSGTYWSSGWDASPGTNSLEVDVTAGNGYLNDSTVSTGATQTLDFSTDVDSTYPRKAIIYVDGNGVQKSVGNTASALPDGEVRFRTYDPTPPASISGVVVAEVWIGAGATDVTTDDIRDRRVANMGAGGVGIVHVQSSEPSNPDIGDNWLDTDNGVYKAYADLGNGAAWHPIPPVQVTDEAVTFIESDVSVSTTSGIQVKNDTIQLVDYTVINDGEDGTKQPVHSSWGDWNIGNSSDATFTAQQGTVLSGNYTMEFEAASGKPYAKSYRDSGIADDLRLILYAGSDTGNTSDSWRVGISDGGGTSIGQLYFYDSGAIEWYNGSFNTVRSSWSAQTEYQVKFDFDFANDNVDIIINGVNEGTYATRYSVSNFGDLFISNDTSNSGATRSIFWDDIHEVPDPLPTSGSATVSWGSPTELDSWDLATYHRTLDNESVTIDVVDGAGNTLFSNISKNFDISTVSDSTNVALKANLSRSSTSNNPTCDYLARRYVR